QKRERCRQCVIYNEHLKHKYRLMLPVTIGGFVLVYALFRIPLLGATGELINKFNQVVSGATYGAASGVQGSMIPFQEILLDCFMAVLLAFTVSCAAEVIGGQVGDKSMSFIPTRRPRGLNEDFDVPEDDDGPGHANSLVVLNSLLPVMARTGMYSTLSSRGETYGQN